MNNSYFRSFLALVVSTVLSSSLVFAIDDTKGFLKGNVTGSNGAALSGAIVTVVSDSQGSRRTTTTDASGNYRVPALSVGSYSVTVSHNGQQIAKHEGITRVLCNLFETCF